MEHSWIACVGIRARHVYFEGFVFLFSHARIGLLIEPGRETEKLIIVPYNKNGTNRLPKKRKKKVKESNTIHLSMASLCLAASIN